MFHLLAQVTQDLPVVSEIPTEMPTFSIDPEAVRNVGAAGLAIGGFLFFIYMLVVLAVFLFFAYCLFRIAKRVNAENPWFAWVPILNTILMIQIAKKPLWWIVLLLIPGVNLVFMILITIAFLDVLGKPSWWVLLFFIPIANLVVWIMLAFEKPQGSVSPPQDPTTPQSPTQ